MKVNGIYILIDLRCPKCESHIAYNGNYYCVECKWALGERGDVKPYLEALRKSAVEEDDTKYIERIDFYLELHNDF